MKKILLSLLMLCAALSAWSQTTYTTNTITLDYKDCDESYITTNAETGIYVKAPKADNIACWQADKYDKLQLVVPDGYVITAVKINYLNKSYLEALGISSSSSINTCDNLALNAESNIWEQKSGAFSRLTSIMFRSTEAPAYVTFVTITYHKHTFTHDEAVAATCVAPGKKESWTCSDCGRTYYDEKGAREVAAAEDLILPVDPTNHAESLEEHARVEATCIKAGNVQYWHCNLCGKNFADEGCTSELSSDELVLPIDPTNHASTLTKHEAVAATCVSTGNVQYWHCSDCDHCFKDEAGATQIAGDNVTTAIDPTNHADKLTEVAFKNASVVEDGVYHHWHCEACSNDYADADGTQDMNGKTVKARYDADALLIGNTTVDESYLFDGAKVTFDGDMVVLAMGSDNHQYDLSETDRLLIGFSHTFKLTANQDPAKTSDYYSTFFTSEGAYKVPATAKAYIGEVKKGEDIDVLQLTATTDGLIPASEAVVLRATKSDVVLMPSCSKVAASDDNMLQGSDEPMTLPDNSYALSLGQHGVGFYDFSGYTLPAHKAYLTLAAASAGLRFSFGDATDIDVPVTATPANAYNLQGQKVDENYRGIVIINGKKSYNN